MRLTLPPLNVSIVALSAILFIMSAAHSQDDNSPEAVSAIPRPADTPMAIKVSDPTSTPDMLDQYCSRCHNDDDKAAGLSVADLRAADLASGANLEQWEKILRRTSLGEMPPKNKPQPGSAEMAAFTQWLEGSLDRYAAAHPDPGRATIRRLNRVEYANAVRDLLSVSINAGNELPADNSGYGFDNIADVLSISPTLMDRYVMVAGKVSRLATGLASSREFVTTYEVPKDGSILNSGKPAYNERASDDLPIGSRGGGSFQYYARYDATYEISGTLNANTNNETDRMKEDRVSVRVPLKAGLHTIGLSFRKRIVPDESVQTLRNTTAVVVLPSEPPKMLPLDFSVDGRRVQQVMVPSYRMSPRFAQANFPRDVLQIDVTGPIGAAGIANTPSRKKIFICRPSGAKAEAACAARIVQNLARVAYRRPVTATDTAALMKLYAAERASSDFERGVAAVVEAILVSPSFLFVVENDPANSPPGTIRPVNDLELATRLSLFLWSSIPDDMLLTLASQGKLRQPQILDAQITRMLADPKAQALTRNFAGQWLYLRNLDHQRPDIKAFPRFDTRLRSAMGRETELFFAYILRENRSLLDFIAADYTFLNQRLAEHYGIPGVNGTAFRKVVLTDAANRGGLLGQASILTVTSYGNHTSVVKRGKWILDNILSAPPPPAPPDIPALKTSQNGRQLSAREQMELHRANPVCASCHVKMDPLGFSLENYDATGAYRTIDVGRPIDASAMMPDGEKFTGLAGLRQVLLARRDEFTRAFTERMLTYALARGVGARDMPTIRAISRKAAQDGYRIQTIIRGIVTSEPFTMRRKPST